jgi:hypothetical protein
MDPNQAVEDFRNRIKNYEKTYETIKDDTLSYVKVSQSLIKKGGRSLTLKKKNQ